MIEFEDNLLNFEESADDLANKKERVEGEEQVNEEYPNQAPPPLSDAAASEAPSESGDEGTRKRRTTLLGNLATGGRFSRGYSLGHLQLHLTKEQRQNKDETFALPPDDYYLMEENDALGIFLEKPDQLPGFSLFDQSRSMANVLNKAQEQSGEDGEEGGGGPPKSGDGTGIEEPAIPPDYVFPVQRNAVEQQSKLAVMRNLRSYQQKKAERNEGKCYYDEDEVDLSFLTAKPVTFLILGKPGIGKTTLAIKLAEKMHSVHLNRNWS